MIVIRPVVYLINFIILCFREWEKLSDEMKQIFRGNPAEISVSDLTVAVEPTNAPKPAMASRSIRVGQIIFTSVDIQPRSYPLLVNSFELNWDNLNHHKP